MIFSNFSHKKTGRYSPSGKLFFVFYSIVSFYVLFIGQKVVCIINFLELSSCISYLVYIGVIFLGKFSVIQFDFVLVCIVSNSQRVAMLFVSSNEIVHWILVLVLISIPLLTITLVVSTVLTLLLVISEIIESKSVLIEPFLKSSSPFFLFTSLSFFTRFSFFFLFVEDAIE